MGPREVDFEDVYAPIQQSSRRESAMNNDRPPIPPAAQDLYGDNSAVERPAPPPNMRPARRSEPVIVRPDPSRQEISRQEIARQEFGRQERAEPRLDRRR